MALYAVRMGLQRLRSACPVIEKPAQRIHTLQKEIRLLERVIARCDHLWIESKPRFGHVRIPYTDPWKGPMEKWFNRYRQTRICATCGLEQVRTFLEKWSEWK